MPVYQKIDVRLFQEAEAHKLSNPRPCGQWLWIELMLGRATGIIPGLIVVSEQALAETIGWPLDGLRGAWKEIEDQGMARADWEAGVIWAPSILECNKPDSPSVVRSWRESWNRVPECPLKLEIYREMKGLLDTMSEGRKQAFAETIVMPKG